MSTGIPDLRIPSHESKQYRDRVPHYPQYEFPQTGDHPIEVYMAVLWQNRKQFLDNMRRLGVLVVSIGNDLLVNAEELRMKARHHAEKKKKEKTK